MDWKLMASFSAVTTVRRKKESRASRIGSDDTGSDRDDVAGFDSNSAVPGSYQTNSAMGTDIPPEGFFGVPC